MNKELTFNCAFKLGKKDFIKEGLAHVLDPVLSSLMHSAETGFIDMILGNNSETYQFILTIKSLDENISSEIIHPMEDAESAWERISAQMNNEGMNHDQENLPNMPEPSA